MRNKKGQFIEGHSFSYPKKKGKNNPKWKQVEKKCACCEIDISVKKCRVKEKNYCSRKCSNKGFVGNVPWNKGTAKISTENELVRKSKKYKEWRISIFERDDYTCQDCKQKGGRLNADHIKPFALFKESRFDLNNGRTLCEDCHKKTETYGWKLYHYKKTICLND